VYLKKVGANSTPTFFCYNLSMQKYSLTKLDVTPSNAITLVDLQYPEAVKSMIVARSSVDYPELPSGISHDAAIVSDEVYRAAYDEADNKTRVLYLFMLSYFARDAIMLKYFADGISRTDIDLEDEFINDIALSVGITPEFVKISVDEMTNKATQEIYTGARLYMTIVSFASKYNSELLKRFTEWIDKVVASVGIVGGDAVDNSLKS